MSAPSELEPELLAALERLAHPHRIIAIERQPFTPVDSATGAALERITVSTDAAAYRYVVKRITPLGDWLARATNDRLMREHQLAATGVFAAMPLGVSSASITSVLIASGAAVIMRDVSAGLLPPGDALLSISQLETSLVGLARMHSCFAGFSGERADRLGLNRLEHWLTPLGPATARREEGRIPRDRVTPLILPGWAAFATLAPEAWKLIEPLLVDPGPVARALRRHTLTLVHGDVKAANFACEGEMLLLLDWSTTTVGPGALDLAWYLCINAAKLPCSRDEVIEIYRRERERLGVLPAGGPAWDDELALSMLTSTMRLGWMRALSALGADPSRAARDRREVVFWAEHALAARQLLVSPGED